MKGKAIFKAIGKAAGKHGSLVMTIVAGIGVVATGILAAKARPEADERITRAKEDKATAEAEEKGEMPDFDHVKLTRFETVKAAAPAYVKAIIVGGLTIALIVGCHVVNARQIGDLAAGYNVAQVVSDKAKKYREAVKEEVGEEKEAEIKAKADKAYADDVAVVLEDEFTSADIEHQAYITGHGMQLFYDPYAAQYFYSSREFIIERSCDLFSQNECSISYDEFRDAIDLPDAGATHYIGWDMNSGASGCSRIRVEFHGDYQLSPNGFPYTVIGFNSDPVPEYSFSYRY